MYPWPKRRDERLRISLRRSAAPIIAAIDRLTEQGAAAGAQQRSQCIAADGIPEEAAGDGADDQPGGSVVAAAVIAAVAAAINAVAPAQPPFAIIPPMIMLRRVPTAIAVALPAVIAAMLRQGSCRQRQGDDCRQ